ncbi:13144_t:CDS:2, partial [Racocetra fulgida]
YLTIPTEQSPTYSINTEAEQEKSNSPEHDRTTEDPNPPPPPSSSQPPPPPEDAGHQSPLPSTSK